MWLVYLGAAVLVVFVVGGLDDQRRRRAEARVELARAHEALHVPPAGVYREAPARAHRDARRLLGHIPAQRDGSSR
ncbi:hypothetical protein SAMN05216251_108251 [Actinacidiphila alni]|uniref:Uncharacterized protein n=1 Tax=Actinacidiphila alni TaxID=380248 RepID=A0A1I2G564_9ACTN|nr:hypothetical protein [Actinacidiphila alni]SFF12127.1 hypothetical protein SAMN05216251_108251 [Actinacidiphila alni]